MKFDFEQLAKKIGKPAYQADVKDLIQCEPGEIERFKHVGIVEFKENGVSIIFKEAPWVVPEREIVDSKTLYLCAFHFHRNGHEDYSAYQGRLPAGVSFNDTDAEVISKLGKPIATGGGGISTVLKKPIPRWLRYLIGDATFQLQLDENSRVEMVTFSAERQVPGSIAISE